MNGPLISILMVSYNSSKYIREAIESILSQTYTDFELVICDDNSTDDTWKVISSYQDGRIKKFRNKQNLGEYNNRNYAISLATGEYLIFIDADDLIYQNGLEFMMAYALRFPDCAMVICRPWDERIVFPKTVSPAEFYQFEYLDYGICGINFTKLLLKTDAVKATSLFPAKVKLGDVYIQYLLALTNKSLVIPDAATWWRRNPGQASERLLNDPCLYLLHELWIKLDMLAHPQCPLTTDEKHIAYENVYGSYLRTLVRSMIRLRFKPVIKLLRAYPIPRRFQLSVFKTERRNYFHRYNGSNPMKDQKVYD